MPHKYQRNKATLTTVVIRRCSITCTCILLSYALRLSSGTQSLGPALPYQHTRTLSVAISQRTPPFPPLLRSVRCGRLSQISGSECMPPPGHLSSLRVRAVCAAPPLPISDSWQSYENNNNNKLTPKLHLNPFPQTQSSRQTLYTNA
jgi:hypothetical protein